MTKKWLQNQSYWDLCTVRTYVVRVRTTYVLVRSNNQDPTRQIFLRTLSADAPTNDTIRTAAIQRHLNIIISWRLLPSNDCLQQARGCFLTQSSSDSMEGNFPSLRKRSIRPRVASRQYSAVGGSSVAHSFQLARVGPEHRIQRWFYKIRPALSTRHLQRERHNNQQRRRSGLLQSFLCPTRSLPVVFPYFPLEPFLPSKCSYCAPRTK